MYRTSILVRLLSHVQIRVKRLTEIIGLLDVMWRHWAWTRCRDRPCWL